MNYYATIALELWVYMSLWFVVSVWKKRNDVADIAWGLGFLLIAWTSFFLGGGSGRRGILAGVLVSLWALRLAWHIHSRHRGKAEDFRYQAWRKQWKWFYLRSYAQVYLLQGALLFMVGLPVLIMNRGASRPLTFWDVIGVAVWLCGFYFEAVADAELARFAKDPQNRGKLLRTGLWKYSRHPNYFGEILQWWGIWLLGIAVPGGLFAIIGPLTISFLIIKVSGIPMLEAKMAKNSDFADYKRTTGVLIPRF